MRHYCFLLAVCFIEYSTCRTVDIVSIVDQSSLFSCMVKVHSIIESSRHASLLRFYFLALDNNTVSELQLALDCFDDIVYNVQVWLPSPTFPNISSKGFDTEVIYSRIYLPHIFNVNKYIYIDNDVVVNADLWELDQIPLIPVSISPYTPRRKQHPPSGSHTTPTPPPRRTQSKAVMGFVYDLNNVHKNYLHKHFNGSNPLVKQVLAGTDHDLFFNGGVAVVDAKLWRALQLTQRAEAMIAHNIGDAMYSSVAVGDQGLFFLLLDGQLASLPAEYNMRRLPNKTVRFLEKDIKG